MKYEDDLHNCTPERLVEMLENIGLDLGVNGDLEACAVIGEAARRLRELQKPTYHDER